MPEPKAGSDQGDDSGERRNSPTAIGKWRERDDKTEEDDRRDAVEYLDSCICELGRLMTDLYEYRAIIEDLDELRLLCNYRNLEDFRRRCIEQKNANNVETAYRMFNK